MKNNAQDLALFSKVMWGVAGNFGGSISDDDLTLRFEVLQEFSIDQITNAGTWMLRNREATFPAVPTTKEFIDAIRLSGKPPAKTMANIECDKVIETLKEWGRDAEPLFNDKITVYLMTKRWNFQKLDLMAIDDPGFVWFRKEFVQAYQDIEKAKTQGRYVLPETSMSEKNEVNEIINSAVKRLPA